MRYFILFFALALMTGTASAKDHCTILRNTGLRLLSGTTFELDYSGLLKGCFSGYLPERVMLKDGVYHFGVFRNGELAVSFPTIEGGRDLSSNPYQRLRILAVSFNDLDHDGQRDVMVIGERLMAKGEQSFVQIYWNCGDRFVYDEKTNANVIELLVTTQIINVKAVQQYVSSKKLKATCVASEP